ncbi:FGGY-family carbohydrate kinase [Devosia sp. MC521]|uniref:FGGY-family carbohydrate kinase n=1 Tax=Devosia sp. MC521 TaxID=2759954 RepID=UPI0015F888ED|nr:FGGY-family carbohydrate kinase [Devosia sp. MC521]MBJ6985809.1 FGGY-family carbohydrate kinase [Devosia sp. MC521]QMW61188.1 FGGY-family carbohydrate kinase [Devosia sp. MC521]
MTKQYFIGVDVGTASARAGVFDAQGTMLASAVDPIKLCLEPGERAESSSADIWRAVCKTVREAVALAGVTPANVRGIGFDATCSLVVLGEGGKPLSISDSTDPSRDIIVWMDHRALEQAERINAGDHAVLAYVGGRISPEMQTPKLLWLAENKPEVFVGAWQFFDLPDFLTWKATGSLARSSCTVTCKWTYLAHEQRWDGSYFRAIGLGALADESFERIGTDIVSPGSPLGNGLTAEAAGELGLVAGTSVGAALIDAHAGGIGTLGAAGGPGTITSRMAYVFGTSACTMASTETAKPVAGVWGPYYDAMVPGLWLSEGGQSAAGAALDHLVTLHPFGAEARDRASAAGLSVPAYLGQLAEATGATLSEIAQLAQGLHVVPEFLGNRAPHANPLAKGVIAGIGMDSTEASLVALYVAGLLGLGYGLRQIIEASSGSGINLEALYISGGAGKSKLVRQLLADSVGVPVAVTSSPEPVLLGSAMLGATAAGAYQALSEAMAQMASTQDVISPSVTHQSFHQKRYGAFVDLQSLAERIRSSEQ